MKKEVKSIYLYDDQGVDIESLDQLKATCEALLGKNYTIKTISAEDVARGLWCNDAALFCMPGGADLYYVKKLHGRGNDCIKKYVYEGGSFLGICAGAYYASSCVEFDKGGSLEVVGPRELGFFKGTCRGPLLAPYSYTTKAGCRAAAITTSLCDVSRTVVYYHGGGFFEHAETCSQTRVIATYEHNGPAIIFTECGKGRAVLSGVHFEFNPLVMDQHDPYLQKIMHELTMYNETRIILATHIFVMLKII